MFMRYIHITVQNFKAQSVAVVLEISKRSNCVNLPDTLCVGTVLIVHLPQNFLPQKLVCYLPSSNQIQFPFSVKKIRKIERIPFFKLSRLSSQNL